jgi:hypothetical protein
MRQHTSAYVSIRQHTSAYVSVCQHTSAYKVLHLRVGVGRVLAYVSIRQHTSAYVSVCQHTSPARRCRGRVLAYVSIRQHTSAYVSIRHLRVGVGRVLAEFYRVEPHAAAREVRGCVGKSLLRGLVSPPPAQRFS